MTPAKPIIVDETGSSEFGGSKADWIADTLQTQLPNNFPNIKALVWFNWNTDNADWIIESSSTAQTAFARSVASPLFASNEFAALNTSPIPVLTGLNLSATPSTSPYCFKRPHGDANCDGNISVADFENWRCEFTGSASTKMSDFNGSGNVTVADFEILRNSFTDAIL